MLGRSQKNLAKEGNTSSNHFLQALAFPEGS